MRKGCAEFWVCGILGMRDFRYAKWICGILGMRGFKYAKWICEILGMRNFGYAKNECARFWGVRDIWYVGMFLL